MKNRIKEIRKKNGLSQQAFADRMGISRNYVSIIEMENGGKEPGDRLISDICREFKVNENWLRYGEGNMDDPTQNDFSTICAEIGATDPRLQKVIMEMWRMTDSDKDVLYRFIESLAKAITE